MKCNTKDFFWQLGWHPLCKLILYLVKRFTWIVKSPHLSITWVNQSLLDFFLCRTNGVIRTVDILVWRLTTNIFQNSPKSKSIVIFPVSNTRLTSSGESLKYLDVFYSESHVRSTHVANLIPGRLQRRIRSNNLSRVMHKNSEFVVFTWPNALIEYAQIQLDSYTCYFFS